VLGIRGETLLLLERFVLLQRYLKYSGFRIAERRPRSKWFSLFRLGCGRLMKKMELKFENYMYDGWFGIGENHRE
jgi:hypothetical protein